MVMGFCLSVDRDLVVDDIVFGFDRSFILWERWVGDEG